MPLALSYARVSGPTDERTASLESQEEAVVALLESRGFTVPPEYRFRERWSGMESVDERQVLIHCRGLVSAGKVKAFGCYDTDRLCRDPDQLTLVCGNNALHDCETIFVRLDHETRSRIGRAIIYIKGLASALEADAIKDRTSRGRAKRYQAGVHAGYGRTRYGYRRDRATGTRTVDPTTGPVLVGIFEDLAAGTSPADVCRMLGARGIPTPTGKGKWTTSTLRVLVRERTYYGHVVGRRTMSSGIKRANGTVRQVPRPEDQQVVLENHGFPVLVGRDLWEAANAAMDRVASGPRPGRGKNAGLFLLAGIIRCHCGFRMACEHRAHRTGKARCYRCTGGSGTRSNGNGCRATLGAAKLEDEIWRRLVAFIRDEAALERALSEPRTDDRETTIRRDLEAAVAARGKLDADARKLVDAHLQAADSRIIAAALAARAAELDADAALLEKLIADCRRRLEPYDNLETKISTLAAKLAILRTQLPRRDCTLEEKRAVLTMLGISATARKGRTVIHLDDRFASGESQTIPCDIP